ncbi:organic cation transporter protein-like [Oppia nitens]|uniref:organic cation transporter protein-like n=1 Tax=Oppia nitens TaxID=1686743 RepID=UPI0023D9A93A|nr:organic cation transporter protein-like [Oppia nitens]
MKQTPNVRQVTDIIGEWGLWQLNVVMFSITIQIFLAFQTLAVSFYAPTISYRCTDNISNYTTGNDNQTSYDYCLNGCQNWTFDKSVFKSTIIDEWHLICDRQGLASLTQSLFMIGWALGGIIFGILSDRFGRKPILWVTIILEIMAGLSSALAVNITHFMISRTVLGMLANGRYLTAFMLVTECVGSKYRATLGVIFQLGWALGYCLLPGVAYLLPNFRHMILATTIPEVLWLVWLIVIPESPRWLIAHRKWDQLELVVKRAVKINSLSMNQINSQMQSLIKSNTSCCDETIETNSSKSNLLAVFRSPNLRRTTLIMFFTWFVNSFVYYGISLNIGDFGGNLFINFLIAGLIEFPSSSLPLIAIKYIGRRPLVAGLMYASGLSCLAVIPFGSMTTTTTTVWPRITIALIGKFFIGCSFNIIYVYTAEVYPTVVRQVGVGTCSMASRVGSMIAPFIKDLNVYTGMSVVLTIFGGLSIADGVSVHFLPETRGQQIADTIDEAEQLNRRNKK